MNEIIWDIIGIAEDTIGIELTQYGIDEATINTSHFDSRDTHLGELLEEIGG